LEHSAPGSFEVPLIGKALAESGKVDALIGLGIIVEGQTHHARLLADNASRALMDVQMEFTMPFGFEILYVNDLNQVDARLDKGVEAALAVLFSLIELEKIKA
jgi:6,7-dimethyl-8-ribityllumazine synthase